MARSLNKVMLIGNLTRDPELRYTPSGAAVCTFSIATNRTWNTDQGEKKEEADFHRLVAWNKLAELCSQFLTKGRKVYVEGRLQTRNWTAQDGSQKTTTEIVINDMVLLDGPRSGTGTSYHEDVPSGESDSDSHATEAISGQQSKVATSKSPVKKETKLEEKMEDIAEDTSPEEVAPDDIPF